MRTNRRQPTQMPLAIRSICPLSVRSILVVTYQSRSVELKENLEGFEALLALDSVLLPI